MEMGHLDFDNYVEFVDDTSVPLTGHVFINDTAGYNGDLPCPVNLAQVCLHDVLHDGVVVACDETDESGAYELGVIAGLRVEVRLNYNNHTYYMAAHHQSGFLVDESTGLETGTPYFDITADQLWTDVDVYDTSKRTLAVDVHGGLCNVSLGTTTLEFRIPSCPSTGTNGYFSRTITHAGKYLVYSVPAHDTVVYVREVRSTTNGTLRDAVTQYLDPLSLRSQTAALVTADATVVFRYHPMPNLTVTFPGAKYAPTSCTPTTILTTYRAYEATMEATEDIYGTICRTVQGSINITNKLGINPTGAAPETPIEYTVCYTSCAINLTV